MCVICVMQRNDFSLMESEPGSPAGPATVGHTTRTAAKIHPVRTARRRRERQGPSVWGGVCSAIDLLVMVIILFIVRWRWKRDANARPSTRFRIDLDISAQYLYALLHSQQTEMSVTRSLLDSPSHVEPHAVIANCEI